MELTGEQQLLRESVRRACTHHCGLDVVRKLENDPVGYPAALWRALGEMGVLGLTLGGGSGSGSGGESEGGGEAGLSMLDASLLYTELGRALAPVPHLVSCVLAAGALQRLGTAEQRQQWLPRLASGDAIASVAWLEPEGGYGRAGVTATASGGRLTGVKRHVPYARAADVLLVLARDGDNVVALLVPTDAPGVRLTQQATVAGDTQYRVDFDGVALDAQEVLGSGDAWAAWQDTMLDAAILLAAQAVGGARAALELAVDYARTRRQFDKPLGAFQAVAHALADAATSVDGAETLAWEAAWARSEGRDVATLAPMAKLYAGGVFRDVTATAQQVFGGVGFTVDFDIQLYFRRAKSWQLNFGDDRHLEELIAAGVLS